MPKPPNKLPGPALVSRRPPKGRPTTVATLETVADRPHAWDRLPNQVYPDLAETEGAWVAFRQYLELGPKRTLDAVQADRSGGKRAAGFLQALSRDHHWSARVAAYDAAQASAALDIRRSVLLAEAERDAVLYAERRRQAAEHAWEDYESARSHYHRLLADQECPARVLKDASIAMDKAKERLPRALGELGASYLAGLPERPADPTEARRIVVELAMRAESTPA